MIRHQLSVDEMQPAAAYELGWLDAHDQIDAGETRMGTSASARRLDAILDAIHLVEPLPHLRVAGVYDGEGQ